MIQLKENIKEVLACSNFTFVKFESNTCPQCKAMAPIVDDLEKLYSKIDFYSINLDDTYEEAAGYGVRALPTFLLLEQGKVVGRLHGVHPLASVQMLIASSFSEPDLT